MHTTVFFLQESVLAQQKDKPFIQKHQKAVVVGVNALIVAVAAKREKELSQTFSNLERIWDEYDVYEKQVEK